MVALENKGNSSGYQPNRYTSIMARILHVIPYMHPSAGGPPVVVEHFVRELGIQGHQSEILTTALFCNGDEVELLNRLNLLAPTSFVSSSHARLLFSRRARMKIADAVQSADLIHIHTLWGPLNTLVRWECKKQRRPYVLMPHGMLDPYSLNQRRFIKFLYLWLTEHKNLVSAERIIYTTDEELRLANRSVLRLPKGVIVSLGAEVPADSSGLPEVFLGRFPSARDRRQILFLGRLHFKKGLDRILRIWPKIADTFPSALLTIAGDGAPAFEQDLRATIFALGVQDSVLLTGRLDGSLKWGAYASSEMFVLPSRQENFAIVVAEAMHMGVPVIVSDKVNTWPHVKQARAGVVLNEHDLEDRLQDAIRLLLEAPEVAREMGAFGRAYAGQCLTWGRAADTLLKCYSEVLGQPACRSVVAR